MQIYLVRELITHSDNAEAVVLVGSSGSGDIVQILQTCGSDGRAATRRNCSVRHGSGPLGVCRGQHGR